jgi:hypothetical protein
MRILILDLVLLCCCAASPCMAHHSRANFLDETFVLQGKVVAFRWANPHALVELSVTDSNGLTTEWQIETQATPTLARSGWTAESLRPGEQVTVRAQPDRNRARRFALLQSILKDDGTMLAVTQADAVLADARTRALSVFGVWAAARRREGGAGIAPGPANEPPLALPLTAKGLEAARKFDTRENPRNRCIPPVSPESLGPPYLHAFEQSGDNIILRNEYMEVDRLVYMDGRAPASGERTLQGHSVGRWEGNVLVIETTHFADNPWGTARGIPSGAQKRVIERFRLTDNGETLTVDFTIEDSEYLTGPFSGSEQWRYTPQLDLVPNKCDIEAAQRYLETQ